VIFGWSLCMLDMDGVGKLVSTFTTILCSGKLSKWCLRSVFLVFVKCSSGRVWIWCDPTRHDIYLNKFERLAKDTSAHYFFRNKSIFTSLLFILNCSIWLYCTSQINSLHLNRIIFSQLYHDTFFKQISDMAFLYW
jgi:hypothetical protein